MAMPSVTELISQVADETGLHPTDDQSVILRALNRALRRIVSETGCVKVTGTIAGDDASLAVSLASLTGLLKLDSVHLTDQSGRTGRLVRVTHPVVLDARPQSRASLYAFEGGSLLLDGPVGVGNSLLVRHTQLPPPLTTEWADDFEAVIVAAGIPVVFQEDLLGQLAMVHILEGYEGDEERAAYYRQLTGDAMRRFRRYLLERGGDEMPNARFDASHFHTPRPMGSR
jgi:hypothetical protein